MKKIGYVRASLYIGEPSSCGDSGDKTRKTAWLLIKNLSPHRHHIVFSVVTKPVKLPHC